MNELPSLAVAEAAGIGQIDGVEEDAEIRILLLLLLFVMGEDEGKGDSVVGEAGKGGSGAEATSVLYFSSSALDIFNK